MWILYALLAGLFFTGQGLLTRHALRGQADAWAFSFFFSLIGAIISFPFMLASPTLPHSWGPWLLGVLIGVMIVVHNYLYFKASNYLEASVSGAISKFKLVWVFVLSLVMLQARFSWLQLLGTLLTIAAAFVIMHRIRRTKSAAGFALIFSSTFLAALMFILFKQLFSSFNVVSLTFFIAFLIPTIVNFVLLPKALPRIRAAFKRQGRLIILACSLGALANLAEIAGLAIGDVTSVLVVTEAFLIITLVGEHFVLRETDQALAKVTAVLLATSGAIIMLING
jgi:drug/metabolite transporter (DMT)-like permease